ncbi:MAG: hypothetical protein ACXWZS_07660 [Gemmatirosa sp.]
MQQEQQHRGSAPTGGGVAGGLGGPRDPGLGAVNGSGDAEVPRAPYSDARLTMASETVPSDQLWRAAIHAAREAAALAADLRRQLASVVVAPRS